MTQPTQPAPTPAGRAAGGPVRPASESSRPDRNSRGRDQRADPGQFSYETVSTAHPGVGTSMPPPPESAVPTQTLAPPAPYRPGPPMPAPTPSSVPTPSMPPPLGAPRTNGAPAPGPGAPGAPAPRPRAGAAARSAVRAPRRARLQLRHINPWTVFKFACVLSIALFVIWLLTIAAMYGVLDATGVVGRINDAVTTIDGPGSAAPIRPGLVFVGAIVIGAVNIVLFIALSTIGSIVYNLCADLIGGVEVTLSERES